MPNFSVLHEYYSHKYSPYIQIFYPTKFDVDLDSVSMCWPIKEIPSNELNKMGLNGFMSRSNERFKSFINGVVLKLLLNQIDIKERNSFKKALEWFIVYLPEL
jgi:hypothetical protein